MKTRTSAPIFGWSSPRFWTVGLMLFILQAGLIWSFAEREHKLPMTGQPALALRVLPRPMTQEELATSLFAGDPTLFQAPSPNGFSGRAWMRTPGPKYHAAEAPSPDAWLSLSNSGWTPNLPAPRAQSETALALGAPTATPFEPTPILTSPEKPPASGTRIEGALRERPLLSALPMLPPQANPQLLANTVVQIAVDPSGQVMTACVMGHSGLLSADAMALGMASRLRFGPSHSPGVAPVWGRVVFSWETVEPITAK